MATTKMTMARRMMTREEIANHVNPFLSKAWIKRLNHRANRETAKHEAGHLRREAKREERAKRHADYMKNHAMV